MKKLYVLVIGLSLAFVGILSPAVAGVNYIQEHQRFEAEKSQTKLPPTQEGEEMFHKSKYQREQATEGATVVPTSEHPKTGQKYERPDWAK